ncbi:hypothetical protein GBA52_028879 [Prunus armeniaca]|nr:hypothetical protein GBA52_028879 [Prunus armeniaca]
MESPSSQSSRSTLRGLTVVCKSPQVVHHISGERVYSPPATGLVEAFDAMAFSNSLNVAFTESPNLIRTS